MLQQIGARLADQRVCVLMWFAVLGFVRTHLDTGWHKSRSDAQQNARNLSRIHRAAFGLKRSIDFCAIDTMKTIIADYAHHQRDIRHIRDQVFVIEQRVPLTDEFDDRDGYCKHVLVYEDDQPLATGRIDLGKNGKVGRVAVLQQHRRRGIGSLVMQALEQLARDHQLTRVWFHAQSHAIAFYEALGYQVCSPEFLEANIPHVRMEKLLQDAPNQDCS